MYKKHFGLKELPFKNNLDFNFFYQKAARLEILSALIYVIKRGDAVIKVTGEVGSGKTTLLRLVSNSVTDCAYLIYINAPNLTPKDLIFSIATELGIDVTSSESKFQLLQLIRNQLLIYYKLQKSAVILVDEAQSMSVDTLEELRLLTNFETDTDKLVQLVLFGQQELDCALDVPVLRQLKSRITYSIHIPQLTVYEVYDYLNHRMRVAEYGGVDFFCLKDAKRIHQLSNGLPRTINTIADQLLMAAYGSEDSQLKSKHFKNLSTLYLYNFKTVNYFYISLFFLALMFSVGSVLYYAQLDKPEGLEGEGLGVNGVLPLTDFDNDSPFHASSLNLPAESTSVVFDSNVQVDKELPKEYVRDELETQSPLEQSAVSNKIINNLSGYFVDGKEAFAKLFRRHKETENWLSSLSNTGYVIQLSTSTPSDYSRLLQRYSKTEIVMNNIHFMLVLNQDESKLILKSLYIAGSSYTALSEHILLLPPSIQTTKPFIVNVSDLIASAKRTTHKLEAIEVR